MMSKMLKGHGFWITATGNLVSTEKLRNREVISVATERFKGRPETKRPSPYLENENIDYPWVMVINSIKTCAIYLYLLVCALERMRLISLELRHSLNATR